jgi:RNA polymerase sigma factor (sigma-70 family)
MNPSAQPPRSRLPEPPPDLEALFGRPGSTWTEPEIVRVKNWLHEDRPLRFLLLFAQRRLGHGTTFEDAEDTWGDFCADVRREPERPDRLDEVMAQYDPCRARNGFPAWLLFCFRRFCEDRRKHLTSRGNHEQPAARDVQGRQPQLELAAATAPETNPEHAAQGRELEGILVECVNQLPEDLRTVFLLRYVEGLSAEETASRLGISYDAVSMRAFRAKQCLRRLLTERGITRDQ